MTNVSVISQPRLPEKWGGLPEKYTPVEAKDAAMACTSIEASFDHATMHQLIRTSEHGRAEVIVCAAAILEKGMQLFSPNRRMAGDHVAVFARKVVDKFSHESLADLNVFIENAAMGQYDGGEYYASIDIARLGKWWERYLGEKADERERIERQRSDERRSDSLVALSNVPGILGMLRTIGDERNEERSRTAKVATLLRLKHQAPGMSDQELRDAYKVYREADERAIIVAAACRRGLLGVEYKEAQAKVDAENAKANTESAA